MSLVRFLFCGVKGASVLGETCASEEAAEASAPVLNSARLWMSPPLDQSSTCRATNLNISCILGQSLVGKKRGNLIRIPFFFFFVLFFFFLIIFFLLFLSFFLWKQLFAWLRLVLSLKKCFCHGMRTSFKNRLKKKKKKKKKVSPGGCGPDVSGLETDWCDCCGRRSKSNGTFWLFLTLKLFLFTHPHPSSVPRGRLNPLPWSHVQEVKLPC